MGFQQRLAIFKVPHNVLAGRLMARAKASELAGPRITLSSHSGAALPVTVVLVEPPVMLSVCNICNRSRLCTSGVAYATILGS